jgi:F-type H+-transporting ATPase subunit epsilon
MAENLLTLEVVTPLKLAVSAEVSEISAPSVDGEFGVLPGHRDLLAALQHGIVTYKEDGKVKRAAVAPGFAEVKADRVVLLVEHWVTADQVDVDEVRDELARAELKVKELSGQESSAEYEQAQRDERWASVRLEVAKLQRDA